MRLRRSSGSPLVPPDPTATTGMPNSALASNARRQRSSPRSAVSIDTGLSPVSARMARTSAACSRQRSTSRVFAHPRYRSDLDAVVAGGGNMACGGGEVERIEQNRIDGEGNHLFLRDGLVRVIRAVGEHSIRPRRHLRKCAAVVLPAMHHGWTAVHAACRLVFMNSHRASGAGSGAS